jgi:hypothetical protein
MDRARPRDHLGRARPREKVRLSRPLIRPPCLRPVPCLRPIFRSLPFFLRVRFLLSGIGVQLKVTSARLRHFELHPVVRGCHCQSLERTCVNGYSKYLRQVTIGILKADLTYYQLVLCNIIKINVAF